VPVSYSYEEIEKLHPIWLPDKEKVWKVQDQMIRHIIQTNKWQIPIYFAVTVSTANKLGLDDHLIMEGMAYRIVPSKGENRIDLDLMWKRYMEECKFRGLNDSTMYKGENDNRLVANYVSGFLQLADTLKNAGQIDEAIEAARKGVDIYPDEWRSRAYLAGLYVLAGQTDSIDSVVEGFESGNVENIYINAARELLIKQKWEESKSLLYKALQYNPESKMAFNNLMIVEKQLNNYQAVDSLAEMWRQLHKDDPAALAELENLLRALESPREN
jgi:tetratricopeptide (TPR) repeat protein